MPVFNKFRHILVEKGHQKRGNMCTIDIRIGHDNNFFIAKIFFFIVILRAGTQRLNHIFDFLVLRDFINTCAGNI